MPSFKTIGLITKPDDPQIRDTVRTLLAYLEGRRLEVLVDRSAASILEHTGRTLHPRSEIAQRCDVAIVVGGDGTLLYAARSLFNAQVPLIGVNRGRLGFLVDITPEEMIPRLEEILAGEFQEDHRLLFHGEVLRAERVLARDHALNDIVVHVNEVVRMLEFDTFIDGRYLYKQRADGLIISTPTGSTAYALSGGGPILHPTLDAVSLVPICPHTLSNRPIVVNARSMIEVVIGPHNPVPAMVSFDGQTNMELRPCDRIRITRAPRTVRLLQPVDHNYFEILRAKLKWSEQP